MKFTWENSDIICGRYICKSEHANSERPKAKDRTFHGNSFTASVTYKIGYLAAGNPLFPDTSGDARKDFVLIAITDGMIGLPMTKRELVDDLNERQMIPMPHDWLVKTIEHLRDAYETL